MKKIIAAILSVLLLFTLCGCGRQAGIVTYNVQREADNFNVYRRITVYNARTDNIVLELEGFFSMSNNSTNEIQLILQTGPDTYKIDYIYLNYYTLYVVEDITGAEVSPYHYEVHFHPTMLRTVDFGFGEESDVPRDTYDAP